jgi:hypothetical protein
MVLFLYSIYILRVVSSGTKHTQNEDDASVVSVLCGLAVEVAKVAGLLLITSIDIPDGLHLNFEAFFGASIPMQ